MYSSLALFSPVFFYLLCNSFFHIANSHISLPWQRR